MSGAGAFSPSPIRKPRPNLAPRPRPQSRPRPRPRAQCLALAPKSECEEARLSAPGQSGERQVDLRARRSDAPLLRCNRLRERRSRPRRRLPPFHRERWRRPEPCQRASHDRRLPRSWGTRSSL